MRRIFISHSNSDPAGGSLLPVLSARLKDVGFDVLVDQERLKPGARWRDDIYAWLGLCHGAVVLLSHAALRPGSIWVARETAILLWRRCLDPAFPVMPVLVGDITVDDIGRNDLFRDMQLEELQMVAARENAVAAGRIVDALATLDQPPSSPLEVVAEQIEALLEPIAERVIERAAQRISVNLGPWQPNGDARRLLALALLQTPLDRVIPALEYLAERAENSRNIDRILDIIAPSWVDLHAARWVALCGRRRDLKPALVLNAQTKFAADMYVRRGSCKPPKTCWPVVAITGVHGEMAYQEIAAEIWSALETSFADVLEPDPFEEDQNRQLRELLANRDRLGKPVFILMRLPAKAAELLPRLQEQFPHITFFFLSGEQLPNAVECPESLFRCLHPTLEHGQELRARECFNTARSILRPTSWSCLAGGGNCWAA